MLYENDPDINKYLGKVTTDFVKVYKSLQEASYEIIRNGFKYPIFVLSKDELNFFPSIIKKNEYSNTWFYHASYLKDLIDKKFIDETKENKFKENYKNPENFCCLLILDPQFCKIVYMPYPEE